MINLRALALLLAMAAPAAAQAPVQPGDFPQPTFNHRIDIVPPGTFPFMPTVSSDVLNSPGPTANAGPGFRVDGQGNLYATSINSGTIVVPFQDVYLKTTGTGTGAQCFVDTATSACGNLSDAFAAAALLKALGATDVTIHADTGPYDGTGTYNLNIVSGGNNFTPLIFTGADSGHPVAITGPWLLDNTNIELVHVAITVADDTGAVAGLTVRARSDVKLSDVSITNTGTHGHPAFDVSRNSSASLAGGLTIDGPWDFGIEVEAGGNFITNAQAITCGGAYVNQAALVWAENGLIFTGSGTTWPGCPATGVAIGVVEGGGWKNSGGNPGGAPPGATWAIAGPNGFPMLSTIDPYFAPSLGSCTSGALGAHSTNYAGRLSWSGATSSSCTVLFGKSSNVTSPFKNAPSCVVTIADNTGSTVITRIPTVAADFIVVGSFVNGSTINYVCLPLAG